MPLAFNRGAHNRNAWVRSSRCHTSTCCIEVMIADEEKVHMRSSVTPERGVLSFTADSWAHFIAGVRAGEFDL
jgi:hypothetical protein